jgi:enterochelin esterase-like enzyme
MREYRAVKSYLTRFTDHRTHLSTQKGLNARKPFTIFLALLIFLLPACQPQTAADTPITTASSLTPAEITPGVPSPISAPVASMTLEITPTWQPEITATAELTPIAPPLPDSSPIPPMVDCVETQGKVSREQISTPFSIKPLFFQLYLPPCYNPDSAAGYPILILLHGQANDDQEWIQLGVIRVVDHLISEQASPPFILALPYEEYYLQDPSDSTFGDSVVKGMLPWIDQHYNTCIKRECRAIGGISRGAGWAIHLGFTYWQQFGRIGAHSLPPFWGDTSRVRIWAREIPVDRLPGIYMDIGDHDPFFKVANEFSALMSQYQIPHIFQVNPGLHEAGYWQAHIEEYLRWYSQAWIEKDPPDGNGVTG